MRSLSAARLRDLREKLVERRGLLIAVAAVWAIVIGRSLVFLVYPQSHFDSDQAVIGLMAKHLSEGRAFPLFVYGQAYLLAVESWLAALAFVVAGPTVAALHATTLALNLAAATLLVTGLVRWCGLAPFQALAASLFFTLAPPFTSTLLIEAGGGNIEPFVYVILLWMLRDRPLWFGALLGVGVLNREFTIFAVPVLIAIQIGHGRFFRADRLRAWLLAAVVFLAVAAAVDVLRPLADPSGPGSRGHVLSATASSGVANVLDRSAFSPAELAARATAMARVFFPRIVGTRVVDERQTHQGRAWLFWPLNGVLAAALLRSVVVLWRDRRAHARGAGSLDAAWYLVGIGCCSVLAYIVARGTGEPVDRYLLLALYAPVGVVAIFFAVEPRTAARWAMAAFLLVWAAPSIADHRLLWVRYARGMPNEMQDIADALERQGIRIAMAGYWQAYAITFLARERVLVASNEVSRVERYAWLAQREGDRLVVIQTQPCESDLAPVGRWHLCRAGQ